MSASCPAQRRWTAHQSHHHHSQLQRYSQPPAQGLRAPDCWESTCAAGEGHDHHEADQGMCITEMVQGMRRMLILKVQHPKHKREWVLCCAMPCHAILHCVGVLASTRHHWLYVGLNSSCSTGFRGLLTLQQGHPGGGQQGCRACMLKCMLPMRSTLSCSPESQGPPNIANMEVPAVHFTACPLLHDGGPAGEADARCP